MMMSSFEKQVIEMKFVKTILLFLILWHVTGRAETGEGGQAAAFLRIPVGARPCGLGNAFTAVCDDGSSISYNPAGLYQIESLSFSGTYALMSLKRKHFDSSVIFPVKNYGTVGVSAVCFSVSNLEGRDRFGRCTGNFNDTELAVNLGYCYRFFPYLGVGLSGKYLHHDLSTYQAHGFGFDAGVHSTFEPAIPRIKSIRLGFSVLNFNTQLAWNTPSGIKETVPLTLRGGIAIQAALPYVELLGTVDVIQTEEETAELHEGMEAWFFDQSLGLRAGYDDRELRFGFTVRYRTITFSYAFSPDVLEIDPTSRFSLQYSWK